MSQPYQILVVDDDPKLAQMVQAILQDIGGYTASSLTDNDKTLEVLRRDRPDIVILDVMMPDPDGIILCKEIKQDPELKDTKVVIFSAKDYDIDQRVALRLGADAFISKVTAIKTLIPTIKKLLEEE